MGKTPVRVAERDHLKALMKLSNFGRGITPARIERLCQKSPDPETICQLFLEEIPIPSDVLRRKWRKTLTALWAHHHPQVPPLPSLPITREQATSTYLLLDVMGFISGLMDKAAGQLVLHDGQAFLHPREVRRLLPQLESFQDEKFPNLKNEWEVPTLYRLHICLEAAGLLYPGQSRLHVDRRRVKRFLQLPRSYQLYVLWHVDTQHVCWGNFAPDWHYELFIMQENLDWIWESNQDITAGTPIDKTDWCLSVAEMYGNLFLPPVVNQIILNDLFARYGLIQFESDGNFSWTQLGVALLETEYNQTLPCGLELLR